MDEKTRIKDYKNGDKFGEANLGTATLTFFSEASIYN